MNTFTSNGDGSATSTLGIIENGDGSATSIYVTSNGDGSGTAWILDAADLSGSGSLTGTASPAFAGTVGLGGTGDLSGVGTPMFAGVVDLVSEGALTADAVVCFAATVDLPSGEGFLTATGRPSRDITVNVLAVTGRQFGITVHGRTLTVKASF